jgi:predicted permease
MAVFIAMICPVGANVAVYAELHGKDYSHAVKTVTVSTIFSIITMPLFIMLADFLWLL